MSLEAALIENTNALRELIAALSLRSPGAVAYAEAKAKVLEPVEAPAPANYGEVVRNLSQPGPVAVEKPKAKRAEKPAPEPVVEAPVAVEPAAPALSYDDIKIPFLTQLVAKKGREAGAALLREFNVPDGGKLSDIPQAQWPAVLEAINVRCAS